MFGKTNYGMIATHIGTRSPEQVKRHMQNTSIISGKNSGRWSKDEIKKFVEGSKIHGKDWSKIADHIGTRSREQVKRFVANKKEKQNKDRLVAQGVLNEGYFSKEEHEKLKQGIDVYGRKVSSYAQLIEKLAMHVGKRTKTQIRYHIDQCACCFNRVGDNNKS